MKLIYLIFPTVFLGSMPLVTAQPGYPDPTFSGDGRLNFKQPNTGVTNWGHCLAIQQDNKIIACGGSFLNGFSDNLLIRLNVDGSLDEAFGNQGVVQDNLNSDYDFVNAMAIQPDGKILTTGLSRGPAGSLTFALVRYKPNGSRDSTFGTQGVVKTIFGNNLASAEDIILQPDGKIIVTGYVQIGSGNAIGIVRYNANGSLDNTFNGDGKLIYSVNAYSCRSFSLALESNGNILIAGKTFLSNTTSKGTYFISRLLSNGTIDPFFGTDGVVIGDFSSDFFTEYTCMTLEPGGKIIAAGAVDTAWYMVRHHPDGTLDNSFGTNGVVLNSNTLLSYGIRAIALQPDGKIIVTGRITNQAGTESLFAIIRYLENGLLDNTFGIGGMYSNKVDDGLPNNFVNDMVLQADGKPIVIGDINNDMGSRIGIVRYLTDLNVGTLDFSNAYVAAEVYPNPIAETATLQYTLTRTEKISIQLYDLQGRLLETILNPTVQEAGNYAQPVALPATLAPGTYRLVISAETGRMSVQVIKA